MTSDGTNTYAWDRANRLLSMGGASYAYDGAGRRIRQTVGANTTNYLLDVSMGLWETLTATTGANVTRYVHSPSGLLSQHDGTSWHELLADGLGSVRSVVDGSTNVLWSSHYAPYGSSFGGTGTAQTAYGYTGEPTDGNGLVYLRNRYYAPALGAFASVDPLETANRYAYVGGNVVNATDPDGLCPRGQRQNSSGRCVSAGRDEYLPPAEQTRTVTRAVSGTSTGGLVSQRVTSLDPARFGAILSSNPWIRPTNNVSQWRTDAITNAAMGVYRAEQMIQRTNGSVPTPTSTWRGDSNSRGDEYLPPEEQVFTTTASYRNSVVRLSNHGDGRQERTVTTRNVYRSEGDEWLGPQDRVYTQTIAGQTGGFVRVEQVGLNRPTITTGSRGTSRGNLCPPGYRQATPLEATASPDARCVWEANGVAGFPVSSQNAWASYDRPALPAVAPADFASGTSTGLGLLSIGASALGFLSMTNPVTAPLSMPLFGAASFLGNASTGVGAVAGGLYLLDGQTGEAVEEFIGVGIARALPSVLSGVSPTELVDPITNAAVIGFGQTVDSPNN